MRQRLRTFVALRCGRSVQQRLRKEADRLQELDGVFHAPTSDAFHLTVQFLGNTDERDLGDIGKALAEVAAATAPIEVVYRGLGAFPDAPRARVVWAGMETPDDERALPNLARAVGDALGEVGYPPERRGFKPHVTIGRLRGRPGETLVEAIQAGGGLELGMEILSDLKLILSDPGDRGYRYIDLTTARLDAECE